MIGIPAIYRDGAFHPMLPVELPEQSNVFVLLPQENVASSDPKDASGILRSAGAWADIPGVDDVLEQLEAMRRSAVYRD